MSPKIKLFIDVVKGRTEREEKTAEEVLAEYTKLTEVEKSEILNNI